MIELDAVAQFQAAKERVAEAARELEKGIEAMLELAGPERSHDEMAELIGAVLLIGDILSGPAKEPGQPKEPGIKKRMEEAALDWLLTNPDGIKRVKVGAREYFGELNKTTSCIDVGHTGATLAHIRLESALMDIEAEARRVGELEAKGQWIDIAPGTALEDAEEAFWGATAALFGEVVAANGIKEGAASKLIEYDAESTLRALHAIDPTVVALLGDETPEQALERAVKAAREAEYARHWREDWPDKLTGAEPGKRLGVANMRFYARQGGGAKSYFQNLERQRLAAGDE